MRKGITPVIALVMLMLITVGMVGIAYTWFSGLTTSQTEKTVAIPPGAAYCFIGAQPGGGTANNISIIITNNGASSNIFKSDFVVATIDGTNCLGALENSVFNNVDPVNHKGLIPGNSSRVFIPNKCPPCSVSGGCTQGKHNIMIGTASGVISTTVNCK